MQPNKSAANTYLQKIWADDVSVIASELFKLKHKYGNYEGYTFITFT